MSAAAAPPSRVCVILHESAPLGAGLAVAGAVPALRALGCEVSVLLPEQGALADAFAGCEIAVSEPPRPLGLSLRGWREPPGTLRRLRDSRAYSASVSGHLARLRPEVVHVNSLHALPEAVLARRHRLPVVLHAHEIPRPGLKRTASVRVAGAVADVIVPVSSAVASIYRGALAPERLRVVHNGVALRARLPDAGPMRVGTVGSVCRRKGADILVQAARIVRRDHPDIVFEHLGPAGLSSERAFEAYLAQLRGSDGAVRFLGPGSSDDALAHWSIFVLPSREEGFPLASLEAMAAGLPVIASDLGAIREQIRDGETGVLVAPEDPAALARAIVSLADDPLRRREIGDAGRRHVSTTFTHERQARGLLDAYRAALAHRAR